MESEPTPKNTNREAIHSNWGRITPPIAVRLLSLPTGHRQDALVAAHYVKMCFTDLGVCETAWIAQSKELLDQAIRDP